MITPTERKEALARVCERAVAALPDSLSERKAHLHDLLALNPPGSPLREKIQELLLFLHDHERAQMHFAELLSGGKPEHDGGPR